MCDIFSAASSAVVQMDSSGGRLEHLHRLQNFFSALFAEPSSDRSFSSSASFSTSATSGRLELLKEDTPLFLVRATATAAHPESLPDIFSRVFAARVVAALYVSSRCSTIRSPSPQLF